MEKIKDYPGYYVTKDSKIYSKINNMYLNPFVNNGYYKVNLHNEFGKKLHTVHRLVAEGFIKKNNHKPFVNHIDGNKLNNSIDNLEWCTHQENHKHASETGLMERGEDRYNNKLTKTDVLEIRSVYSQGWFSQREIASAYDVNQRLVWSVVNNKAWKHV